MKRPSLFSKFKRWLKVHDIPVFLPALLLGILVGVTLLAVLANLLQWNVIGAFTSRTAFLAYAILFTVAVGYLIHLWENSHK